MEINIHSQIGDCSEFIDNVGKRREASIVISPLKVRTNDNQDKIQIISGCNLWRACFNVDCYYSLVNKSKKAQVGK